MLQALQITLINKSFEVCLSVRLSHFVLIDSLGYGEAWGADGGLIITETAIDFWRFNIFKLILS